MTATYSNPYKALLAAGVPIDSHESDLYCKATPESTAILKASGWAYTTFLSNIDGTLWYDVAFGYEPWWEARS